MSATHRRGFNGRFWSRVFSTDFVPQLSALVETLEKRVLPAFDTIEEEADRVAEETWEAFMSAPATGDEDPSRVAEEARDAGVSYYMLRIGVRQGLINMFAAALFHAFEQQVLFFHRREVLSLEECRDSNLFRFDVFLKRMTEAGIPIESFPCTEVLAELRLVANAVKHADGHSADELRIRRPDMFKHPQTIASEFSWDGMLDLYQPLMGENLYVSIEDIRRYHAALVQFWSDLADALTERECPGM